jgi:hypothetical protein
LRTVPVDLGSGCRAVDRRLKVGLIIDIDPILLRWTTYSVGCAGRYLNANQRRVSTRSCNHGLHRSEVSAITIAILGRGGRWKMVAYGMRMNTPDQMGGIIVAKL